MYVSITSSKYTIGCQRQKSRRVTPDMYMIDFVQQEMLHQWMTWRMSITGSRDAHAPSGKCLLSAAWYMDNHRHISARRSVMKMMRWITFTSRLDWGALSGCGVLDCLEDVQWNLKGMTEVTGRYYYFFLQLYWRLVPSFSLGLLCGCLKWSRLTPWRSRCLISNWRICQSLATSWLYNCCYTVFFFILHWCMLAWSQNLAPLWTNM